MHPADSVDEDGYAGCANPTNADWEAFLKDASNSTNKHYGDHVTQFNKWCFEHEKPVFKNAEQKQAAGTEEDHDNWEDDKNEEREKGEVHASKTFL